MKGKLEEINPTEAVYTDANGEGWKIVSATALGPFTVSIDDVGNRYQLKLGKMMGAGADRDTLIDTIDGWVVEFNAGKKPKPFVEASVVTPGHDGSGLGWLALLAFLLLVMSDKKGRR